MKHTISSSARAQRAVFLVEELQGLLVQKLSDLDVVEVPFQPVYWLRDEGTHGGGTRYVTTKESVFNRASVNFSHVHYDDEPTKKLASASALSTIIHPKNPLCPSIHLHFSWTEMKDGKGYWRLMADLNPSHPNEIDTKEFDRVLKQVAGDHFTQGKESGDQYFYIPALEKHRGVSHFYLEGYDSGNFEKDYVFTQKVAEEMIRVYVSILSKGLTNRTTYSTAEKQQQVDYHTLYLYQVLTLDKGTIAGILVHNQNDLGVMGSLPARVNADLLASWIDRTPAPMRELVKELVAILESGISVPVGDAQKLAFVNAIRQFYAKYPEMGRFRNVDLTPKK